MAKHLLIVFWYCSWCQTRWRAVTVYLFKLYIRDLLKSVLGCNIGCNIAGRLVNILAFADDIVLVVPSWRGLQCLLDIIGKAAADIDMLFNTRKTVCMIFSPCVKYKTASVNFQSLV